MERGSTIGMDRFGLEHFLPTAKRVEVIARLCAEGYARRMVLSHDANCWSDMLSEDDKRRTRPRWHYNHIPDDILPALRKAGVSDDQIDQMLVRNPRAIFEARNGPAAVTPVVLGAGAYRYEVIDDWAKLPPGLRVQRRRGRGRRRRAGPRLRVQSRRSIRWSSSTATATSCARGARACSAAPTACTWRPTTRSGCTDDGDHTVRQLHARRQGAADHRHPRQARRPT